MTSILAHRGSAHVAPDNSLQAFRAAAAAGADGVELDVRRTVDGSLVLHHDIEAAGLGPIATVRRRDLPGSVASLEEALELCSGLGLVVNVEVKSELTGPSHDPSERCARESAALCASASATGRIIVSSFSVPALEAVRESAEDLPIAWLVGLLGHVSSAAGAWSGGVLGTLGLEGVHPFDPIVDVDYVRAAHEAGLAVRVWTVDDPARIALLDEMGVEAVITNDVPAALQALGRG